MKWIKRFLTLMGTLIAALCLFILLCGWKPELLNAAIGIMTPGTEAALPEEKKQTAKSEGETEDETKTEIQAEKDDFEKNQKEDLQKSAYEELVAHPVSEEALYEKPENRPAEIPGKVSGRTGYVPVEESGEQIPAETAEALRNQIGYGETGEGLTFDGLYYPYYAMLNETGQSLYRQVYANAQALNDTFAPVKRVTRDALRNVFMAVYNDHPELFWLETGYVCKYMPNGECVEIKIVFNRTAGDLQTELSKFQESANAVLAGAAAYGSDYEKEIYVHNVLSQQVEYNLRAPINQSAYSALVNGSSVCAGYARAFQYLMQQMGIPCYYCTGYSGENHAWNIAKLGEEYYNVDVTWDDTEPMTYDYFNKTDKDYAKTHMRQDLSVYLPACNGETYRTPDQAALPQEEQAAEEKRSLSDVGFASDAALLDMPAYYENCYAQAQHNSGSVIRFTNVIYGEDLWNQWLAAYQGNHDAYEKGYVQQLMQELGANACRINVRAEELQGGYYLLDHTLTMQ